MYKKLVIETTRKWYLTICDDLRIPPPSIGYTNEVPPMGDVAGCYDQERYWIYLHTWHHHKDEASVVYSLARDTDFLPRSKMKKLTLDVTMAFNKGQLVSIPPRSRLGNRSRLCLIASRGRTGTMKACVGCSSVLTILSGASRVAFSC